MRNPNSPKRAHNAPNCKDKCLKKCTGKHVPPSWKLYQQNNSVTFYFHTDGLDNVFDIVI